MDIWEERGLEPTRVIGDHKEETVEETLTRGYWTAFTIYPKTKMDKARMVEIVPHYGSERVIIDSSADWGESDSLSFPRPRGSCWSGLYQKRMCILCVIKTRWILMRIAVR